MWLPSDRRHFSRTFFVRRSRAFVAVQISTGLDLANVAATIPLQKAVLGTQRIVCCVGCCTFLLDRHGEA